MSGIHPPRGSPSGPRSCWSIEGARGSGGLRHTTRVAAGIVRRGFDRRRRQRLRCVGKQLARIVGHGYIRVDLRVWFRQRSDHGMSQSAGRQKRRSSKPWLAPGATTVRPAGDWNPLALSSESGRPALLARLKRAAGRDA